MSRPYNTDLKVAANQQFLREIALNAYGYGHWYTRENGGTGSMGLVKEGEDHYRIIKFNTNKSLRHSETDGIEESENLRMALADIALNSDLPPATLAKVREKLGLKENYQSKNPDSLLSRKVVAAVVKLIDKDIWKKVDAGSEANKNRYSTQNLKNSEKSFLGMKAKIHGNAFTGAARKIGNDITGDNKSHAMVKKLVDKVAGKVQEDSETAVSFEAVKMFEDALRDAARRGADLKLLLEENGQKTAHALLKLSAVACGHRFGDLEFDSFAPALKNLRGREAANCPGLTGKTLANILCAFLVGKSGRIDPSVDKLTDMHANADEWTNAINAESDLVEGELAKEEKDLIGNLNGKAKDVLGEEAGEFSNLFQTQRERNDAVRILEVLSGDAGKIKNGQLGMPLIRKAVTEARMLQADDAQLTEKTVWRALVGTPPPEGDEEIGSQLAHNMEKRMYNDIVLACGGDVKFVDRGGTYAFVGKNAKKCKAAYAWAKKAAAAGLKYDAILEMIRNPGRMATANDFNDAAIRMNFLADGTSSRQKALYGGRNNARYYHDKNLIADSGDAAGESSGDVQSSNAEKFFGGVYGDILGNEGKKALLNLLSNDPGDSVFSVMFGFNPDWPFRDCSEFTLCRNGDSQDSCRLVVTPNDDPRTIGVSPQRRAGVNYRIEFVIDNTGNVRLDRQWVKKTK